MDAAVREMTYAQAIQEAMSIAKEADETVIFMGEDIGVYGGAFRATGDLVQRFGEDRVMDTPISELGGAGVAVGAALTGHKPIFDFQFSDFATLAMEQIEGAYTVPIGKAEVRRQGHHVTIVATALMMHRALEAVAQLASEGMEAEVIDLRSPRPLDTASVKKIGRMLCVCEGVKTFGIGVQISAAIAESQAFDCLDAPILRLGGAECPIPYNLEVERAAVPQVATILDGVRKVTGGLV